MPIESTETSLVQVLESDEARDQLLHWLAEALPYHRIEVLCEEHGWEKPDRRTLWNLRQNYKDEIAALRESWQARMWKEGLAHKDTRLQAEIALVNTLFEAVWDGGEDYSGRPKYQMRDLLNGLELIGRETGQIGTGTGADDNRFQVLIQNIVQGVAEGEHATIEVGTEGRLLPPVGIPANGESGVESPLLDSAPIPVGRRRRQRKVVPDGEGSGTARTLPARDEGREDSTA